MTYTDSCTRLAPEIEHFADVVRGADFATPVPTGDDGWTLDTLVRHVGNVHRWAELIVRTRARERIPSNQCVWEQPDDASALAQWLQDGAAPLIATLHAADPDAPVWSWGADQHVRFWARRQLHETTIHRVDAEWALGRASAIDTDVAVDGVSEFFENAPCAAYFAPNVSLWKGRGETIAFDATDADAQWLITLEPNGFRWEATRAPSPTARVSGTAADLNLLVWNRYRVADVRFRVEGDARLADWFVTTGEM